MIPYITIDDKPSLFVHGLNLRCQLLQTLFNVQIGKTSLNILRSNEYNFDSSLFGMNHKIIDPFSIVHKLTSHRINLTSTPCEQTDVW